VVLVVGQLKHGRFHFWEKVGLVLLQQVQLKIKVFFQQTMLKKCWCEDHALITKDHALQALLVEIFPERKKI
jgi:hypothetical protein